MWTDFGPRMATGRCRRRRPPPAGHTSWSTPGAGLVPVSLEKEMGVARLEARDPFRGVASSLEICFCRGCWVFHVGMGQYQMTVIGDWFYLPGFRFGYLFFTHSM